MTGTNQILAAEVETCIAGLRPMHGSGGMTGERSSHWAWLTLKSADATVVWGMLYLQLLCAGQLSRLIVALPQQSLGRIPIRSIASATPGRTLPRPDARPTRDLINFVLPSAP